MRKFYFIGLLLMAMVQFSNAQDTVRLAVSPITLGCQGGSMITVPVTMANGTNITGCQFSLAWDVSKLQYVPGSAKLQQPFLAAALFPMLAFGEDSISKGKLRFAWGSVDMMGMMVGVTVGPATPIFTVKFNVLQPAASVVQIVNKPTPIAVGSGISPVTPKPYKLFAGTMTTGDVTPPIVICPNDTIIGSSNPLIVNDLAAQVSDDCNSLSSISYSLSGATTTSGFGDASGETFNLGLTTLKYTAVDGTGNSATCVSTVSVGPDTLTVRAESSTPNCGEAFFVDVKVDHFNDVITLGFTLEWDTTYLKFDSVSLLENQFIGVDATDLGYFQVANGKLTFAWYDIINHNAPNDTRLFRIYFKVKNGTGAGAVSGLNFTSSVTPQLAGTGAPSPSQIPVIWKNGLVQVTDPTPPTIICHADTIVSGLQGNQIPYSIGGLYPTATDNCGIDSIAYQLTGATVGQGEMLPNTTIAFNAGETTVTQIAFDETGNSDTCSFRVTIEPTGLVTFILPTTFVQCTTNQIIVPITVDSFINVSNFGFTLDFDDTVLSIDSIGGFNPSLGPSSNYYSIQFGNQLLIGFGNTPSSQGVSIADGQDLLKIYVHLIGGAGTSSQFVFDSDPTAETPNGQVSTYGVDGLVIIGDSQPPFFTTPCPLNQTYYVGNDCNAVVSFITPVAIDGCDGTNISLVSNSMIQSGDKLSLGVYQISYLATDQSNNSATCKFDITVLDTIAPVLVCPTNLTVSLDAGQCFATISSLPQPISLSDNCTVNPTLITNFNSPDTIYPDVTHFYSYTAIDASNNVSFVCNFGITAENSAKPIVLPNSCNGNLSFPCDSTAGKFLTPPQFQLDCGSLNYGVLPLDTTISHFPIGNTNVVFYAFNGIDTAKCQFTVNIFDNKPPVILKCPTDTIINAASGCTAILPAREFDANDNCTSQDLLIYEYSPNIGSNLQAGETIVTFKVTDASGNQSTCTFKVTVNVSQTASLFGCSTNQVFNDTCFVVANWMTPIPVGFCGIANTFLSINGINVSNTTTSINVFAGLVDTVLYTATDGFGNSAACLFTITVKDTTSPTVNCPKNITVDVAGNVLIDTSHYITSTDTIVGCQSVQCFFGVPSAADNCSQGYTVLPNAGPKSGEPFEIGINTVSWRVVDASGNAAVCDFTITVVPLDTPVISGLPNPACPNSNVVLSATTPNPQKTTYAWTGPANFPPTNAANPTIFSITPSNAGPYFVSTVVNGCPTPMSLPFTATVVQQPTAVLDMFTVLAGDTLILPVLNNDLLTTGDPVLVQLALALTPAELGTLTNLGNGTYRFIANSSPGTGVFNYQVCSETCPTLCDEGVVQLDVQPTQQDCSIIPNVLTPNGDGQNDQFLIFCIQSGLYPENEFWVYNQWGDLVYNAKPYKNDWEGDLFGRTGEALPDGTYFYIFKPSPTATTVKGFLTIFR